MFSVVPTKCCAISLDASLQVPIVSFWRSTQRVFGLSAPRLWGIIVRPLEYLQSRKTRSKSFFWVDITPAKGDQQAFCAAVGREGELPSTRLCSQCRKGGIELRRAHNNLLDLQHLRHYQLRNPLLQPNRWHSANLHMKSAFLFNYTAPMVVLFRRLLNLLIRSSSGTISCRSLCGQTGHL